MDARRSKRVAGIEKPVVMVEDEDVSGNAVGETSKKKRKTREEKDVDWAEGAKPAKRVKGKRGLLKMLLEMPMDILFEIFGQLNPIDLLSMARTTKAFRNILMSRTSITAWRAARSNIAALPDCPDDLSEPQYATLMFLTRCSVCHRDLSIVHISWYSRARCCNSCLKKTFLQVRSVVGWARSVTTTYPSLLAKWIPFFTVSKEVTSRKNETYIRQHTFIWEKRDEEWASEYRSLQDPQSRYKWVIDNLEQRYAINKHARACALWHWASKNTTTEYQLRDVFRRDAEITSLFKELGYEEEIYKILPSEDHPLDPDLLEDLLLSPVPIGESNLLTLKDSMLPTLLASKESREYQEHSTFFSLRKHILQDIYLTGVKTLPVNSPRPEAAEVYRVAEAHDFVDYSKSATDALCVPFKEIVVLWRRLVGEKLVELIAQAHGPGYDFDRETVGDLVVANIFSCNLCGYSHDSRRILTYNQAAVHTCINFEYGPGRSLSQRAFSTVFGHAKWIDVPGSVKINDSYLDIVQQIVKMCGYDPKVATVRQMDELNPIFECLSCNSLTEGRATMSWSSVLQHQITAHRASSDLSDLIILKEPTSTTVWERIQEEQARETFKSNRCIVFCSHCDQSSDNIKRYRDHLKTVHNITKLKYEELIFSFKEIRIPPEFRLWPPREEGESENELEEV
ncbi:hypothetical protein BDN70DRAFT_925244 [Pholiota conissans]|uniref:F-box domain-containing protein n=1 Tax=Pholiota conissans TaxID=109636 RepID=A0A9P5YRA5_9AGAR|nr:hypothetical protein BDN70DRAFT_925244 [Pholiota conissans]